MTKKKKKRERANKNSVVKGLLKSTRKASLVFAAFVADYGNVLYHQNRLNSINKTALIYAKNHKEDYDIEKVKELVRKNDNEAKINKCDDKNKKITLVLKKSIKSYSLSGRVPSSLLPFFFQSLLSELQAI